MAGNTSSDAVGHGWQWNRQIIMKFAGAIGLVLLIYIIGSSAKQDFNPHNVKVSGISPAAGQGKGVSFSGLSGHIENADFPTAAGFTGNVALIMEEDPSAVSNFVSVVTHFRNMLGPQWEVVILTRRGWKIPASRMLRDHLTSGAVKVRFLPKRFDHFPTHSSVSIFLTSPWLWEQFQGVNRLLMFQTDSILCSRSAARVDDFLAWDYLGAPIIPEFIESIKGDPKKGQRPHPNARGYNGGLSLRNPRLFLDIARRFNFTADLYSGPPEDELPNYMRFEDQWFMRKLEDMPALMHRTKLPPPEVAGRFAVETWYFDRPLGYHQPHRWQANRYAEIVAWCPEVGMLWAREAPDPRWGKPEEVKGAKGGKGA